MIHIVEGDLLKSDCNVIAHQANCRSVMGGGIAAQIKEHFHEAFVVDIESRKTSQEKYGTYSSVYTKGKLIYNLYGQLGLGKPTTGDERFERVEAFKSSVEFMMMQLDHQKETNVLFGNEEIKLGMPYLIGCGLAGGNWTDYMTVLEHLSEQYNRDIYLYKFTPPSRPFVLI